MADPRHGDPAAGEDVPKDDSARPRTAPLKRRTVAKRITLAVVGFLLLGLVSVTAVVGVGYATTTRPDPNADFQTAVTVVYYNDGKKRLGTFQVQNRTPLTFAEMPKSIKDAVVAAENRDVLDRPGHLDPRHVPRRLGDPARRRCAGRLDHHPAVHQDPLPQLRADADPQVQRALPGLQDQHRAEQGADPRGLPQHDLLRPRRVRDPSRESGLLRRQRRGTDRPAGRRAGERAEQPGLLDPGADDANVPRLKERYSYVLASMAETGAITPAQAASYAGACRPSPTIETNERYGGPKGFLLKMVERELVAAGFDESQIQGGGLKITTTFDKQAQNAAVKAAQRNTRQAAEAADKKASDLHAAVASVEVGTGEVLALYGGPDFVKNSRNWATTPRPTASTFKTYALAAGLDDGFSLRSTFMGNTFTPPGDSHLGAERVLQPVRADVPLLRATADSINTAFVDMTGEMKGDGPEKIMKMAEAVGAPKGAGWDASSRVALGTAEVSPLDQAGAYATFANEGTHVANHVVREVRDADDKIIYQAAPEEERAVSEDISRDVNYALSNVVEQGTGGTVRTLNRPVAGKTGTKDVKDDIVSAWFVAYTPQISTAVMYVAGEDGNGDLDGFARPGRQHVLRRHLPGADLGGLHADRHEGTAGRGLRRARVRQPRRRRLRAPDHRAPRRSGADPDRRTERERGAVGGAVRGAVGVREPGTRRDGRIC